MHFRRILTLPPKVKTLAQQQADFTSEGAPPPGVVTTAPDGIPARPAASTVLPVKEQHRAR